MGLSPCIKASHAGRVCAAQSNRRLLRSYLIPASSRGHGLAIEPVMPARRFFQRKRGVACRDSGDKGHAQHGGQQSGGEQARVRDSPEDEGTKQVPGIAATSVTQARTLREVHMGNGSFDELFLKLNFTHDNDYNPVQEQGKQVLTGSLIYEAVRLNTDGDTELNYFKRRDLLRNYSLQPRDLRRIDPSLSGSSPCLTVRDSALLICLGGMRGIVAADKAIIFEPDSPLTRKFIDIVSPRLAVSSGSAQVEARVDPASVEGLPHRHSDDRRLPFELECCEGALMVLVGQLDFDLQAIERRITALLKKLPRQVNTENLEELRKVKSLLVTLEDKSEQAQELLTELLEDEDDIAGMNLTPLLREEEGKRRKGGKTDQGGQAAVLKSREEPELDENFVSVSVSDDEIEDILDEADKELEEVEDLVEYYLQRCTSAHNEAERLLVGMRDMEESISVVLSSRRFELSKLELALSIASFAAALGAMISGIFGMNLRSCLEMSIMAFYATTFGIVALCFAVFWVLFRYTKRRSIL